MNCSFPEEFILVDGLVAWFFIMSEIRTNLSIGKIQYDRGILTVVFFKEQFIIYT